MRRRDNVPLMARTEEGRRLFLQSHVGGQRRSHKYFRTREENDREKKIISTRAHSRFYGLIRVFARGSNPISDQSIQPSNPPN